MKENKRAHINQSINPSFFADGAQKTDVIKKDNRMTVKHAIRHNKQKLKRVQVTASGSAL